MKSWLITMASVATLLASAAARARQDDIVFIAPTNHAMPFAQFDQGRISGGILKDLGEAIAKKMGRRARFVSVPSKRVAQTLEQGRADCVCYVLPTWMDGDFIWSMPFIPNSGLVAASAGAPPIGSYQDLADQPVGTVLGYRYVQFEAVLGHRFKREDARTMQSSLDKMDAGRMQYAILDQLTFDYHQRGKRGAPLRAALRVDAFTAQCAFSRHPRTPAAEARRAIAALVGSGGVDAILASYR